MIEKRRYNQDESKYDTCKNEMGKTYWNEGLCIPFTKVRVNCIKNFGIDEMTTNTKWFESVYYGNGTCEEEKEKMLSKKIMKSNHKCLVNHIDHMIIGYYGNPVNEVYFTMEFFNDDDERYDVYRRDTDMMKKNIKKYIREDYYFDEKCEWEPLLFSNYLTH